MARKPYGLYLRCYPCPGHGYGRFAIELCRYLINHGVSLRIGHIGQDFSRADIPNDLQPYVCEGKNKFPWEVILAPPDFRVTPGKRAIYVTMWESTRLHHAWVDQFGACDAVIVPSEFCQTIFDASGVSCPIHKVPLGVDNTVFKPAATRNTQTVLGCLARTNYPGAAVRKSLNTIIEAFGVAFPDDTSVSLEVKLTSKCTPPESDDSRIRFIAEDWSERKLAKWYASLTAFVNVSHAEGFGLTTLEAMACGTPVVSPLFSGVSEYMNVLNCLPVNYTVVPASGIYAGLGSWCEVDFWSLVDGMRIAADGGQTMTRIAQYGYRTALGLTWNRTCERIHSIITDVGVFAEPSLTLPSGIPISMAQGESVGDAGDEYVQEFGIGRAQRRPMPELPTPSHSIDNDSVVVLGPPPHGCGVGQYGESVANAIRCQYVEFMSDVETREAMKSLGKPRHVLLSHHRHYWEKLPLNKVIYSLYDCGHAITLDVHDPGGIEELSGYVSRVIYHTPAFEGYIEKALPNAERTLVPLMCPEMPEGGTPLLEEPDPDITYIGWHGLFVHHKGLELVLGALSYLQERKAPFGVIAFGDFAGTDHSARQTSQRYYEECLRMREALHLKNCHIEAREFSHAEILATLKQCGCFVLPYTTRVIGQSSAVTAVMQPGRPIIVSDVPMFADVVKTCAKPLEELNAECIANTIQHMFLVDDEGRAGWSLMAQAEYHRRTPAVIAERYREVLYGKAVAVP